MKSITKMTPGELGAFIESQRREQEVKAILPGGAAVAIYSKEQIPQLPKAASFYATLINRNKQWLFKVRTKSVM
jgi:hypothetical protein